MCSSSADAKCAFTLPSRGGVFYEPVLRPEPTGANAVTWGEMVEARLLAEFRGQRVSLQRLRPAVLRLREEFGSHRWLTRAHFSRLKAANWCAWSRNEVSLDRELQLVVVRNNQLQLDLQPSDSVTRSPTKMGWLWRSVRPDELQKCSWIREGLSVSRVSAVSAPMSSPRTSVQARAASPWRTSTISTLGRSTKLSATR